MTCNAAVPPVVDWAAIHRLDLVYRPDCWQLCGDAHCCSFARHKARFRILGGKPFQELPLLPGEWQYLQQTGATAQFQQHTHKVTEFGLDEHRAVTVESVVSHRAGCACDHATRPTICRLYPLFPQHDVDGRLLGIEPHFGIYEEMEALDGIGRACALDSLPFAQLSIFLELVGHLAKSPLHLFYLHAYRIVKRHAVDNLRQRLAPQPQSAFTLFEWLLMKGRVVAREAIRTELRDLADRFAHRYGNAFVLPAPSRP